MNNQLQIELIEDAIANAYQHKSKLSKEALNTNGFSTHKIKHLLNNLITQDTNYLEVGVLRGSTFIAALSNNNPRSAFAVDNWSEFDASEHEFKTICNHHGLTNFKTINKDCFSLTTEDITETIDVYLYDAGHEVEDQFKALTDFDKFLADSFILIVDDYSWDKVRHGTQKGIEEMNYEVVKSWELYDAKNSNEWWNGIYIAVINKRPRSQKKVAYATYVDHQPEVNYPVKFIKDEIPQLKIFCSDKRNQDYLKAEGLTAESIERGINEAMDISIVQNICIDKLFADPSVDYVVWIQADTFLTPEARTIIREFCVEGNEHRNIALRVRHIRAFHKAFSTYFGPNVFGRNSTSRYTGDGAYTGKDGQDQGGSEIVGSDDCCIDIGYLSIPQFRKHIAQHDKTYLAGSDHGTKNLTDREFLKHMIDNKGYYTDVEGLIEPDSIYYPLIEKLGLVDDYKYAKSLLPK
jgi:hypothetical protein